MNSDSKDKDLQVLEDRGIIKQKENELDEEDKYSSVIKNINNNK